MQKTAAALILFVVATCALLAIAFGPQAVHDVHATTNSHAIPAQCEEDQPCWDCHTMGNHLCGPVVTQAVALQAHTTKAHKAPKPAVCGTPWACDWVASHHYAQPRFSKTGVVRCPKAYEPHDTLHPEMGDYGIVCRPIGA